MFDVAPLHRLASVRPRGMNTDEAASLNPSEVSAADAAVCDEKTNYNKRIKNLFTLAVYERLFCVTEETNTTLPVAVIYMFHFLATHP